MLLKLFDEMSHDSTIVDLGCGDAQLTLRIRNITKCEQIIGVDIMDSFLASAHRRGIHALKADLNSPFPIASSSIDLVNANQVIEHLVDPVSFIREIHRILKLGGFLIISTENLSSIDNIFALITGHSPFSVHVGNLRLNPISPYYLKPVVDMPPHVSYFTYHSFILFLRLFGFEIVKVRSVGFIEPIHARFLMIKGRKGVDMLARASTTPRTRSINVYQK